MTPTDTSASRTLRVPDGTLAHDLVGPSDGPLVVASPGLGDLRSTYRFLAPALAEDGCRVAPVDLRGHGGSSTGWPSYDEGAVADDLLALVDELGGPAVLVGNSFSGGAAVVAAARRPDLVRGLVLSGAFVRDVEQGLAGRLTAWLVARTPLGRPLWTSYYPRLFPSRRPDDLPAEHDRLRENLAEPGRWEAVRGMVAAGHAAAQAALAQVQAPALVVMGTADPDFPDAVREAHRTAEDLGGPAEVLLVQGAGHYPHAERPDVVTPAVRAFVAGLPADR